MSRRLLASRRRLVLGISSLVLSVAGLGSRPAHAADTAEAPAVGEVVVVATPLDARGVTLSRTPANAQSLRAGDAGQQGPTNLADLLNGNVGSVSVSDGTGNPYQNDINYRGFQATSLLGAPVGLAVYFDGVRVNEPFGSIVNWDLIPMNAVASVDVQPGSNAIFGLNALGGALVVNTRNGHDDSPGAAISVLGGSFGRRAATFEIGGADQATHTDYFATGNYDQQNGFRNHSGSQVEQLFGKVRWRGAGDRTLVQLSGALADTTLNGTQSLPMDMFATPQAAYTWPDAIRNQMRLVNLKASHWLNDTNQVSGEVYYRQSNARSRNSNAQLDDGCLNADGSFATASGVVKCANQAPGGTAVNSVTGANALALGYGRWTSSINTSLVASTTRQDTVGAAAQWGSSAPVMGHKNDLFFGGAFDQSSISYRQNTDLARLVGFQTVVIPNQEYGFTANGLAPSASNLPQFTGSNVLSSVALGSRTRELGFYVTDTVDLTHKLSVTASGSFDSTSIDQSGVNDQYLNSDGGYSWADSVTGVSYYNPSYASAFKFSNSDSGAVTTANGLPSGSLAGPESNGLNGSHKYQRFNPRVGFNYNFDAATGVFGGYSESMRAPTSIELSCANPNSPCTLPTGFNGDPDLKAVTARTFELGGRGAVGGKVAWNAAVYDSRLQNDIQFIATSATYGYFFNVGDTERRGVELGAQIQFDKWSLSANYGYVAATYRSPFTTAGGESVRSGDTIPGIPASTFKLRAGYAVTDRLRLGGAVIVAGDQYAHGNESNTDPNGKTPGYTVVDLDAQYRIGRALKLSLNIDNLFGEKYATYGLSGMTSVYTLATEQFRTPAQPRGIWLKVTYAFGAAGRVDKD